MVRSSVRPGGPGAARRQRDTPSRASFERARPLDGGGQERILRGRIRSVQATKKITRAMELIAGSRIVKAQQRVHAAVPYSEKITEVVSDLAAGGGATDLPLLAGRDEVRTTVLRRDRRRPRPVRRVQRRRPAGHRGRGQGRRRAGQAVPDRARSAGSPRPTSASAATRSASRSRASAANPSYADAKRDRRLRRRPVHPGRGRQGRARLHPVHHAPATRRSCCARSCR